MDEGFRFVARLRKGEKMAALCAELGISRKTGDKIVQRYQAVGVRGLTDRSRRPHRHANQPPWVVEQQIVGLKKEYPGWGAPKIRERLRQRYPDVACPAISTVHAVLDRHGLVSRARCDECIYRSSQSLTAFQSRVSTSLRLTVQPSMRLLASDSGSRQVA